MAGLDIKLEGVEKLERRLHKLSEAGRKCAHDAINETGFRIVKGAKKDAPVDTGRLRSSIRIFKESNVLRVGGSFSSRNVDDFSVIVGTNVKYASHIEFGTKFMRARPFLRPNVEANVRFLRNLLKKCIDRETRRGR